MTPPRPSGLVLNARLVVCISPRSLWPLEFFSCNFIHRDERGGGLTGQPENLQVDTATIRTVLNTNHVDLRSFSSKCWALRRTHKSADPIRLLCIRLASPLTLSLPSGFVANTRFLVCVSPRALWLAGDFLYDCMFWYERGGGFTGQPVGPQVDAATIRTVLSTNRVDSRSFSSICWAFRRTHTSADPIRLLCTRLASPLTLSLPSGLVPSARLMVCVPPRALRLAGILLRGRKICTGIIGTRTVWALKGEGGGMITPPLQYAARLDGGGEK